MTRSLKLSSKSSTNGRLLESILHHSYSPTSPPNSFLHSLNLRQSGGAFAVIVAFGGDCFLSPCGLFTIRIRIHNSPQFMSYQPNPTPSQRNCVNSFQPNSTELLISPHRQLTSTQVSPPRLYLCPNQLRSQINTCMRDFIRSFHF